MRTPRLPPPLLICLCLVVGLSTLILQSEGRACDDTSASERALSNIFSHTAREPGKVAAIELEFLDTPSSLSGTALEQVQQQVQEIKESRQNEDPGEPIRTREEVNSTAATETTTSTSETTATNDDDSQTREESNSTSSPSSQSEAIVEDSSPESPAADGDGNETSATSSPSADLDTEADSSTGNNSTDDTSEELDEGDDLEEADTTTTTAVDDDDSNGTAVPSDDATLGPSSLESQSPAGSSDLEEAATPDPSATTSPTTLVGTGGEEPTAAPAVETNATSAPSTTPVSSNSGSSNETETPATSSPATTSNRNTIVVTVQSWFVLTTEPSNWTTSPGGLEGATSASTKSLTTAYSKLASEVVNQINDQVVSMKYVDTGGTVRRYLRLETPLQQRHGSRSVPNQRRNLQGQLPTLNATVDYDPSTADLTSIRPAECPESSSVGSGQVCLAAFGQYDLDVDDSEDSSEVFDVFVFQTQKAIEDGVLQEKLDQVDPDSVFTVVGAPGPLPPPPLQEATQPPTPDKDTESEQENKSGGGGGLDGVMLGLIIAICITLFLVAVLLAVYFYLKKSGPASEIADKGTADEADDRGGDKDVADSENPETAPPEAYPGDDADADRDDSDWPSSSNFPDGTNSDPNDPTNNEDDEKLEYKRRVEELVAEHCPEETENVDRMMEQFEGREKALIAMLENMEEVERELEKEQGIEYDDDESSAIDDWSEDPLRQQRSAQSHNSEETKEEVQE